ncbi:MAG: hypothetical protein II453_03495 [Alphaproteobacteria bacterium]|nr:hypothetical protein [Alphaproteobacteria bacterium]
MIGKAIRDNVLSVIQFWQRNCYGTDVNMRISVRYDEIDKENFIVVLISKGEYVKEWYITENEDYNPYKTVEEIGNELTNLNIKLN